MIFQSRWYLFQNECLCTVLIPILANPGGSGNNSLKKSPGCVQVVKIRFNKKVSFMPRIGI